MPTPPPELSSLQRLFYEAIATQDPQSIQALKPQMRSTDSLTFEQGLSAYQGTVVGKLCRALEEIYPICYRLVGVDFFTAMAKHYIHRFPSRSPDLGAYGAQLSQFLAQFGPAAALPYLPDVACLEWHWHRVFNSAEQPTLDLAALGQVPPEQWEELVFELPGNSVLLASAYPVHRIWQVNQSDYTGTETIDLDQGGVNMFIWRDRYETRIDLPSDPEWQFLQALSSGETFGNICAQLATYTPAIDVTGLLPLWVQRGWITGFSVNSTPLRGE